MTAEMLPTQSDEHVRERAAALRNIMRFFVSAASELDRAETLDRVETLRLAISDWQYSAAELDEFVEVLRVWETFLLPR